MQLPPVHHHQSSLAELTRRLWRHQRSYPLPTDHTTQLIVFFESIKSTSTASLSSLKTLSSSKSHTSFSKSKDQKPTNVYIRSPTEKWPTNILAHPTNHKEPNFQRDPFHFVAWIYRSRSKIGAESLSALEIRQKNRNPNECWLWGWMVGVDVASNLLLVSPANFGGGGLAVRCFGFFVFFFFFFNFILSDWNKNCKRVKIN